MKRVYVDETIEKIIEKQRKKCERVLQIPTNPSYDKAKMCLEELQALTDLISSIESLHNTTYPCAMSQSDTNSKHYRVLYVSSRDELLKIIKSTKNYITELLDRNCCEISTRKVELNEMGTYVKVCKVISDPSYGEEYMRKVMLEKMYQNGKETGKYAITPDQFEKLWDEVTYEHCIGKTATYYVSIGRKF